MPPEMRKLVNRWLVLPIGLGVAAVAGWVLLSSPSGSTGAKSPRSHAEIDQESREQLRQILRHADEEER